MVIGKAGAAVSVEDDEGSKVTLDKPAQRVVSLAPHVTELLFAAGGGRKVVGVVDYSDYPPEAKALFLAGLPGPAAELGLGRSGITVRRSDR